MVDAKTLFNLSDCCQHKIPEVTVTIDSELLEKIKWNRIGGIAAANIFGTEQYRLAEKERTEMEELANASMRKTEMFLKNMSYLCQVLKQANFSYALLKGAYLTTKLYKKGNRTSNDIDMLIHGKEVGKVDRLLKEHGFVQGYVNPEGELVPATRKQIVMSKLNYGETVPYVKLQEERLLSIDINFSIDYKPPKTDLVLDHMLSQVKEVAYGEDSFYTLDEYDFLIHLCCHQFKEAVIFDYFHRQKDIMLYKYSDMNLLFHHYDTNFSYQKLLERMQFYGLEAQCYYCFDLLRKIYPSINNLEGFSWLMKELEPEDKSYLKRIIDPPARKAYRYQEEPEVWFVADEREKFLEEIPWKDEYLI